MLTSSFLRPGPKSKKFGAFDVNNTCRICLTKKGVLGLFSINTEIRIVLDDIFRIELDDTNVWKICIPCLKSIEAAVQFKDLATAADRQIKLLLDKPMQKVRPRVVSDILSRSSFDDSSGNENSDENTLDASFDMSDLAEDEIMIKQEILDTSFGDSISCVGAEDFLGFTDDEINTTQSKGVGGMSPRSYLFEKTTAPSFVADAKETFQCRVCNAEFLEIQDLQTHRKIHKQLPHKTRGSRIQCKFCLKVFKYEKCYLLHLAKHENGVPMTQNIVERRASANYRVYYCQICFRKFSGLKAYQNHRKKNHGDKDSSNDVIVNGINLEGVS